MKAKVDCVPCVLNQVLRAAKASGAGDKKIKKALSNASKLIPEVNFDLTPPEIAVPFYETVEKVTGNTDPYKEAKIEHINKALSLYSRMCEFIRESKNSLKEAVKLSIIGNSIDLGSTRNSIDVEQEFNKIASSNFVLNDFALFKERVKKEKDILFIADNAGETVFDRPLTELLVSYGKRIIYAVKDVPIINDATVNDAEKSGIKSEIISTGSKVSGTLPKFCSSYFNEKLFNSKLIIAKGQANYETLSDLNLPVLFLFKVKCVPIAIDTGYPISTMLLIKSKSFQWE